MLAERSEVLEINRWPLFNYLKVGPQNHVYTIWFELNEKDLLTR
jgi:hypothetical protein